ncbi:MAG: STM3941 family protein, partial [Cruoricaptor ignavus]|nr:STM3941 family protein [Cruoricaptor ignavus]
MKQIEIPLSKKKLILTLMGSIVFVILGFWFLLNPPKGNTTFAFIMGIFAVLFFGSTAIISLRKIFDRKVGLIINEKGIIDNSSGVSAGLIRWDEIQNIKTVQVTGQKFLILMINNPEKYLNKVTNPLKRNLMNLNHKTYGSPIGISANSLQISFNKLHQLLL